MSKVKTSITKIAGTVIEKDTEGKPKLYFVVIVWT